MAVSRSKKALLNTIAGFADELAALICGLILPRLILLTFGSSYNGITSSITQFVSCISLMKAGIGGATRVALYKPLAEKNYHDISAVVRQTEKFMRKVALLFVAFVLFFAAIYPVWICDDFDWLFTFSLILIISMGTFAQYYFGLTYKMVLYADQRQCIPLLVNIIQTIANTLLAVVIIMAGGGIHVVKFGSSLIFVISPLCLSAYAKKYYHIDKTVDVKEDLIDQRWQAVWHEVANFVNSNTDIMVLTIFSSLGNVSIYTVYHYVIVSIRKVVTNFISGFGAAFGNMNALKQYDLMQENLRIFEVIVYSVASVVYSVTFVMITPFAMVYTKGVTDVNYYQPLFGIIITFAGAFSCFRIPYETVVKAVGHYRQTRNGAFTEAIINIVLSVFFVIKYGLIGVSIGTLVAALFRTVQYTVYLSRNVLKRNVFFAIYHVIISLAVMFATYCISKLYITEISTIMQWIGMATVTTIIAVALTGISDILIYRKDTLKMLKKIKGIFKRNLSEHRG